MPDFLMKGGPKPGPENWFSGPRAKKPPPRPAPKPAKGDDGEAGEPAPIEALVGAVGFWAGGSESAPEPDNDGPFAGARTVEEVDALAGSEKKDTTEKLTSKAAEVGVAAKEEKPAAVTPHEEPKPATQESLLADLDAAQAKEEADLDGDKTKGLADLDAKIAAEKKRLDGAVLGEKVTAGAEADLSAEAAAQEKAVAGQFQADTKANFGHAADDQKIATDRAGHEADELVKRGDAQAAEIETKGITDGVHAQAEYMMKSAQTIGNAASAAQKVRDDGKPEAQAQKIQSEAQTASQKLVTDGIAAMQRTIAAAKQAAQKHREDAKAAADKLRQTGSGNSTKAIVAAAVGTAQMGVAMSKNMASVDAAKGEATGDVKAAAETGREKQRAKASETLAGLQKQRDELAERLDKQIEQQKKGVETRIAALKRQVTSAGAHAGNLGKFVSTSIGQIDKVSDVVDRSVQMQEKAVERQADWKVNQATAVMAKEGKEALVDIDQRARAAKLRIAQAGQAAVAAQATAGMAVRKKIDEATGQAEKETDAEAGKLAGELAGQTGAVKQGLDDMTGRDVAAADKEAHAADARTANLEAKDFEEMQRKAEAAAKKIKDKVGRWHLTTDQNGINELLREYADDPDAMQMLKDEYQKQTGKTLDQKLGPVFNDSEMKEAKAYEASDMETANVAILEQGDKDRIEKDVTTYYQEHPDEVGSFSQAVEVQTGDKASKLLLKNGGEGAAALEGQLTESEAEHSEAEKKHLAEEKAKLAKDPEKYAAAESKVAGLVAKLDTALGSRMHVGSRDDVTSLMVGLSPAEVAILKEKYQAAYHKDLDDVIEEKLDGKDRKAAKAELSGDKVRAAEALVEQSADGMGTNLEVWKKAMETLDSPEDRERLRAEIEKQSGRSYDEINKRENSGYDRDKMKAEGTVDQEAHDVGIATADYLKATQGSKIQQGLDAIGDTIGDELGESDSARSARRRVTLEMSKVANNLMDSSPIGLITKLTSDGNANQALDAMASLKGKDGEIDPEKMAKFKAEVEGQTGRTVDSINKEKYSDHTLKAANDLSAGNLQDAQVDRMIASGESWLHKDPDAMSKALEAETDPKKREAMKAKLDEELQRSGYPGGFSEWSQKKLNKDEAQRADERYTEGKVSDLTALHLAADTTLGFGKNTEQITAIMQNYPPGPKLDAFKADFEARYHMTLDTFLRDKATSAGEKRDFDILLKGNYDKLSPEELTRIATDNPQELIQRVKDLHAAARDGVGSLDVGNMLGNALADMSSSKGAEIDGRLKHVKELEAKLDAGQTLSDAEKQALVDEVKFMSGDKDGYVEQKNQVTSTVAEGVGDLTEIGVDALTGSTDAGQLAGGLVKIQVNMMLNPARYGPEQASQALLQLGAQMAVAKATGGIKNPFAQQAIAGVLNGLATSVIDYKTMAGGLNNVVGKGLEAATSGSATGLAGAAIDKLPGGPMMKAAMNEAAGVVLADDWNESSKDLAKGHAQSLAKGMAIGGLTPHHETEEVEAKEEHPQVKKEEEAPAATKPAPSEQEKPSAPAKADHEEVPVPKAEEPVPLPAKVEGPAAPPVAKPKEETFGAPDKPSETKFSEPVEFQGRKKVSLSDASGETTATVKNGNAVLTFPADMPVERRIELAREALKVLDITPRDAEAMLDKVKSSGSDERVTFEADPNLNVASPDRAAELARKQWDDELMKNPEAGSREYTSTEVALKSVVDEGNLGAFNGECASMPNDWQRAFAREGEYVPIMSAKNADHRWMLAGGEMILDPTFGQMHKQGPEQKLRDDVPGAKHQFEPFVGTYAQLVERVQHGLDNDYFRFGKKGDDAHAVIEEVWGIRPPKEGSQITVNDDVSPWDKQAIQKKDGVIYPERDDAKAPEEKKEAVHEDSDVSVTTEELHGEELGDVYVDVAGAENAPEVSEKASAREADLTDDERAEYQDLRRNAHSNLAETLIERALAAGNPMKEVRELAAKLESMKSMSDDDIHAVMTGRGSVIQVSGQSCVPTSLQIAISKIDPVTALKLAEDPRLLAAMQRTALDSAGASFPQHGDITRLPPDIEAAIQRNPELRDVLADPSLYSNEGKLGLGTKDMPDLPLLARHDGLADQDTKVRTVEDSDDVGGGQFKDLPHDEIQAVLDKGGAVPFGAGSHARTIIDHAVDGDGNHHYVVQDPNGTVYHLTAAELDALKVRFVMLPQKGEMGPSGSGSDEAFGGAIDKAKAVIGGLFEKAKTATEDPKQIGNALMSLAAQGGKMAAEHVMPGSGQPVKMVLDEARRAFEQGLPDAPERIGHIVKSLATDDLDAARRGLASLAEALAGTSSKKAEEQADPKESDATNDEELEKARRDAQWARRIARLAEKNADPETARGLELSAQESEARLRDLQAPSEPVRVASEPPEDLEAMQEEDAESYAEHEKRVLRRVRELRGVFQGLSDEELHDEALDRETPS